jgi:signal transduction histidine kinase
MNFGSEDIREDITAVSRIEAVPTILDVICRTTGMGFAAVARVTENRWIACSVKDEIAFGLVPGGELKVKTTICDEIRQHRDPVIIDHVEEDETYRDHHTPAMYGFQSHISMPIVLRNGKFFGTLCAIDPRPARLNTPEVIGMFKLFAELIAFHLDAAAKVAASEVDLAWERQTSALREQFIAVLGHDLRNPLAAIDGGMRLLQREKLNGKAAQIVELVQGTVMRMSGLIDNVLDFARGRLGGGITLTRSEGELMAPALEQVVAESQASHPERVIDTRFELTMPVTCDRGRIAQLFSNLLGNALTHGAPDKPIVARVSTANGMFELWVANAGDLIPPEAMERLFTPFSRGEVRPNQQGLGLGLYIAAEIARAHGGTLSVSSTQDETRFTFKMPLG